MKEGLHISSHCALHQPVLKPRNMQRLLRQHTIRCIVQLPEHFPVKALVPTQSRPNTSCVMVNRKADLLNSSSHFPIGNSISFLCSSSFLRSMWRRLRCRADGVLGVELQLHLVRSALPFATFHRHPHVHARALCRMFHRQEHPHTPGGSGLGSHVVRRTADFPPLRRQWGPGTRSGTDLPPLSRNATACRAARTTFHFTMVRPVCLTASALSTLESDAGAVVSLASLCWRHPFRALIVVLRLVWSTCTWHIRAVGRVDVPWPRALLVMTHYHPPQLFLARDARWHSTIFFELISMGETVANFSQRFSCASASRHGKTVFPHFFRICRSSTFYVFFRRAVPPFSHPPAFRADSTASAEDSTHSVPSVPFTARSSLLLWATSCCRKKRDVKEVRFYIALAGSAVGIYDEDKTHELLDCVLISVGSRRLCHHRLPRSRSCRVSGTCFPTSSTRLVGTTASNAQTMQPPPVPVNDARFRFPSVLADNHGVAQSCRLLRPCSKGRIRVAQWSTLLQTCQGRVCNAQGNSLSSPSLGYALSMKIRYQFLR